MPQNPQEPQEPQAARTTIVGARPPATARSAPNVPRGIEVLVRNAAVDAEFRELLVAKRAEAAREIDLTLDPAEAAMLAAIPERQLRAIIAVTRVPPGTRRAFLGKAAAVMLAALGTSTIRCECSPTLGTRGDVPPGDQVDDASGRQPPPTPPAPTGIRPDPPTTQGKRPS